jgi:hypothetical protein
MAQMGPLELSVTRSFTMTTRHSHLTLQDHTASRWEGGSSRVYLVMFIRVFADEVNDDDNKKVSSCETMETISIATTKSEV